MYKLSIALCVLAGRMRPRSESALTLLEQRDRSPDRQQSGHQPRPSSYLVVSAENVSISILFHPSQPLRLASNYLTSSVAGVLQCVYSRLVHLLQQKLCTVSNCRANRTPQRCINNSCSLITRKGFRTRTLISPFCAHLYLCFSHFISTAPELCN
jgi:hypothetical protein